MGPAPAGSPVMTATENWSVPISALQHFLYCPRQCALIHLEQIWTENVQTSEGRLMHERTDQQSAGLRRGIRTVTAMPISNSVLGIHGVADVVEFAGATQPATAMPVEYKRGRAKKHRADEVQLCAQALCLEHMLNQHIASGALYYGAVRRRQEVVFDAELRRLTEQTIHAVRQLLESGKTPPATYAAERCDRCSLLTDCRPDAMDRKRSVVDWVRQQLQV